MLGYHANYLKECEDFISQNELIISDDADFLGTGMYFWERLKTAQWWKNTKKTKRAAGIVQAEIVVDMTLDMTDNETGIMLEEIYALIDKSILAKYSRKAKAMGKVLDEALGYRIDAIYDGYPGILPPVIRARQKARKEERNNFVFNTKIEVGYEDYYCFRPGSDDLITQRQWVEE